MVVIGTVVRSATPMKPQRNEVVRRDQKGSAITRKVAYELTLARTQFLRDSGYTVVEKWEHETPAPWT